MAVVTTEALGRAIDLMLAGPIPTLEWKGKHIYGQGSVTLLALIIKEAEDEEKAQAHDAMK